MRKIKKYLFFLITITFYINITYSQVWVYKGEPFPLEGIPSYYTDLPDEFRIAPLVKQKKIKSYEVKLVYPNEKHYSGYVQFKNEYDTNGIPLQFKGMNYEKYGTGGYHFDPVYNVDSTYYHIDSTGKLDTIIRFYHTGRLDTSTFAYDSKGFYTGPKGEISDSMNYNWPIRYDEKGRIIKKGMIEFIYNIDRISKIIEVNDIGEKFLNDLYSYDEKNHICKNYQGIDTVLKEKIYCDDNWKAIIKYEYKNGFKIHNRFYGTIYSYFEYYPDEKLKTIYQKEIKGNVLTSETTREFKYNSRGDKVEETTYDKFGNFIDKYIFIYEYYD